MESERVARTAGVALTNFAFVGVLLAVSASTPVLAQTASQITPHSYEPVPSPQSNTGALPAQSGQAAPDGAQKLRVRVGAFDVDGGLPELNSRMHQILNPLVGETVSVAEIFAAARAIEAAYAQEGFPFVRVVVPAQVLKDGATVRLVVIDGFLERVDLQGVPRRVRRRIAFLLKSLADRRGVRYADLERQLLLAAATPGVELRSTLAPGNLPGSSLLVIDARQEPIDVSASLDNAMAASIGGVNLALGVNLNSVFGLGELTYLRASGDPNTGSNGYWAKRPRERSLAGGFVLPLGPDGLTVNLEFVESTATPKAAPGAIGVASLFDRYSIRARYPFVYSHALTVSGELSFDVTRDELDALAPLSTGLSLDRLRVLRFAADSFWQSPWAATLYGRVSAAVGIDGLGARSARDATPQLPLSRQGTDAAFQKVEGELSLKEPFAEHLAMELDARGQFSFNQPMANSEQFGLVDPRSLSGFDAGAIEGDAGYVVRDELSSQWTIRAGYVAFGVSPYVFGAFGHAHDVAPTILEPRNLDAGSYGVGIHALVQGRPAGSEDLTIEWANQARLDGKPDKSRLNLTATAQI